MSGCRGVGVSGGIRINSKKEEKRFLGSQGKGVREGVRVPFKVNVTTGFIELEVPSDLHGVRVWRRISTRGHVTRKGRATRLAIWQSTCAVCGDLFEIDTRFRASSVDADSNFRKVTCLKHRMTSPETQKLRFAKAASKSYGGSRIYGGKARLQRT